MRRQSHYAFKGRSTTSGWLKILSPRSGASVESQIWITGRFWMRLRHVTLDQGGSNPRNLWVYPMEDFLTMGIGVVRKGLPDWASELVPSLFHDLDFGALGAVPTHGLEGEEVPLCHSTKYVPTALLWHQVGVLHFSPDNHYLELVQTHRLTFWSPKIVPHFTVSSRWSPRLPILLLADYKCEHFCHPPQVQ